MTQPRTPPGFTTLVLLTAFSVLSLNMFLPSLAAIGVALNTDYATVSLAISGYLAVTAIVQLIVGPLSDRIGRRPVMLAALGLFTAASIGCASATTIWTFLGFRMLQAALISGYVIALAVVSDTTAPERAAGRIGYIGMTMAIAPMLGPVLGGLLDTAFGWRANFYVYSVGGLLMLVLCWRDLGETRPKASAESGPAAERLGTLLRAPRFWAYALCTTFSTGAFYIFLTGAPLVAAGTFGLTSAEIGGFIGSITAGFMLGSFLSGRFSLRATGRFGAGAMLIAGRLTAGLGLLAGLALMAGGEMSPLVFFGSTIFVGLGNGLTMPSSNAGAMAVRPHLAGSAAGLSGAMVVAGGALLTWLTGRLLPAEGAGLVLHLLMLAAVTASLIAALWAVRLSKPDQQN